MSGPVATSQQIDVSVLMPVYNAMPYLHRSLQSVVDQTLGTDRIEVVAVDDGSSDGSGEALDSWAERYPELFRVVHAHAPSGGPAGPRNTALDLARGRFVFFLDADDFLGVEALERMVAAADTNGSDIVLGRVATTTGRGIPGSMFRTTDLDADLFTSNVYGTLSVQKLFRRDLLEKNDVRFPTHFPILSDQPFAALAFLRAGRISVLADYDYYFLEWRDDGKHVTRSGSVSDRMDVVESMCDLIVAEVPDDVRRTPLLKRHLQGDLWRVMIETPGVERSEQEHLLARVAVLVRRFCSSEVSMLLTPDRRVVYELLGRGLVDEALAAVVDAPEGFSADILVAGERAYAVLPYFRDPAVALPDELYDASRWVRVEQSLTSFALDAGLLRVHGTARLRGVDRTPSLRVLVRSTHEPTHELAVPVSVVDDGFTASVDLLTVADGAPLPDGRWAVFVEVTVDGVVRPARLGTKDDSDALGTAVTVAGLGPDRAWQVRAHRRARTGRLVLQVGAPATGLPDACRGWSASWDGEDLLVSARAVARVGVPLTIACTNGSGDVRDAPFELAGDRLSGRIPVSTLPEGRWRVVLHAGAAAVPVPGSERLGLGPRVWRRRMTALQATPDPGSDGLVLELRTVGFVELVRRLPRRVARRIRRRR